MNLFQNVTGHSRRRRHEVRCLGVAESCELRRRFDSINRLLVPNLTDWSVTGTVLDQFGARFGFETVGRSRLTNDALIAMSAARRGLAIQTTNAGDFGKLAEIRQFHWEEISI